MSLHYFNINIAAKYGLHEAIVLQSLGYWLAKNVEEKRNFKEGRAWTFNSVKDMQEKYFPYFTEKVLYSTLRKLVEKGIILKGNYNKFGYDKTTWYTLSDLGEQLLGIDVHTVPKRELERTKFANNVEAEQNKSALAVTTPSKIDRVVSEKRENGSDLKEQSNSSAENLDNTVKQSGSNLKVRPIPVIETVVNEFRNININSILKDIAQEVQIAGPVICGYVRLPREELAEKCPLTYRKAFAVLGSKLYGKEFLVNEKCTAEQKENIESVFSWIIDNSYFDVPKELVAIEQKLQVVR